MSSTGRRWCKAIWLGILAWFALGGAAAAAPWFALGPYGGDARSIAADPQNAQHLYLGTANGWVYQSRDGGLQWTRLAQVGNRNDLVIDHILVDGHNPRRLIVGAWQIDHPDGGIYISEDAGKSWYSQAQMRGQSVRSLGRSLSRPTEIVAGTLKGVYRSTDNGVHWTEISPAGSAEIHEVQSVAIDPKDGDVMYAGTWHLPWKTTDGGSHWVNITRADGIIDDSDVFSIIVDPEDPSVVYASACSGIYKSSDAGVRFEKVQGIPNTARRTRKLMQDPANRNIVFAGTTEGLYRTVDAGARWERLTPADIVVNDIYVDASNPLHVLLATDHGGVLRSEDGGATFEPSNDGFSARQVVAYAANPHDPSTIYVGVVNDKSSGGVFASHDGGVHWEQKSEGLGGRDVFSLQQTADGAVLAGTAHGVFRLEGDTWTESSKLERPEAGPKSVREHEPREMPAKASHRPAGSTGVAGRATAAGRMGSARHPAGTRAGASGAAAARRKAPAAVPRRTHRAAPVVFRNGGGAMLLAADFLPGQAAHRAKPRTAAKPHVKPAPRKVAAAPKPATPGTIEGVVYALAPLGDDVLAGTSAGMVRSNDAGRTWAPFPAPEIDDARFLSTHEQAVLAGTLRRLAYSPDAGAHWQDVPLPKDLPLVAAIAIDSAGNLWAGGREGVFYTADKGASWQTLRNLFLTQVDSIYSDAATHRILVTSTNSSFAFAVSVPEYTVRYWDTGWKLRFARPVGDHLIGATLFDGMVLQPRMVDSAFDEGRKPAR